MNINPVKAFSDNYIWVIEEGNNAVVVDPGESKGVLSYLEENQLSLQAILLTHNHDDHIGGVKEVLVNYPNTPVYGPKETSDLAEHVVQEGDELELLGQTFNVFKTAGHSKEHISFLMGDHLFCGDALFSAGCGRVFTGDYQAQYDALHVFNSLNEDVKVYVGHEYTQTNLRFAHSIEPSNKEVSKALEKVNEWREQDLPTLPSTIGNEIKINLFLQAKTLEDFITLRNARDQFK